MIPRTIRQDDRGPAVLLWQQTLNARGANLVLDGDYGPATKRETLVFQAGAALTRDAVVGPKTWGASGVTIDPPPSGYRRMSQSDVTPAITAYARQMLIEERSKGMGWLRHFSDDTAGYIEEHFHIPGGPRTPHGYHLGVTVFVRDASAEDDVEVEPEADTVPPPPSTRPGGFELSQSSLGKLHSVHPDLRRVIERAIQITPIDFTVLEGRRSIERQRQLVASGASQTLRSRHLTGHAVDIAPLDNGTVSWAWPLYYPLATAVKAAANEVGVEVEWGGDWTSFKDGPHWQLPWKVYPT
jgi:peptidoglycan L-alanyl-D-glutamate endopeptidase CwlK